MGPYQRHVPRCCHLWPQTASCIVDAGNRKKTTHDDQDSDWTRAGISLGARTGAGQRAGAGNGNGAGTAITAPLTPKEAAQLRWMREEEKLARDVYRFLFTRWNVRIFANIGDSEEQHFRAIGTQLERFGVADPSAGLEAGRFSGTRFAQLYAELTAKGATSLKDALEVGIAIEQLDIADLETALVETTQASLKRAYTSLMTASYNHLDSFEMVLDLVNARL